MAELLAQNFMIGNVIILLAVGLGLLAVCIPRPRKKFQLKTVENKASKRHAAAGSFQQTSKYARKKKR